MSQPSQELEPQWNFPAAVAAWVIPGMGHIVLGQKRRGVILCVSILCLWLGGILIGGISVIDRHDRGDLIVNPNNPSDFTRPKSWWWYGQMMIAPSFAVDLYREKLAVDHSKATGRLSRDPRQDLWPDEGKVVAPYKPSIGRVAEQGTLYTALAGMLNLLAIIDVLYCDPRARRQQQAAATPPIAPANIAEAQA